MRCVAPWLLRLFGTLKNASATRGPCGGKHDAAFLGQAAARDDKRACPRKVLFADTPKAEIINKRLPSKRDAVLETLGRELSSARDRAHLAIQVRLTFEADTGEIGQGDVAILDMYTVRESAIGLEQVGI